MLRVVFDRIVQIPDGTAGGTHQILHRAIFQKGGLKRARTDLAAIAIRLARRAGPDLGNVTVTAVELREAGFRADDAPLRVIEQTVRRHIASDMAARALIVSLHIIEDLLQRATVKKVF